MNGICASRYRLEPGIVIIIFYKGLNINIKDYTKTFYLHVYKIYRFRRGTKMSNLVETIVNPNYAFENFYLEVNLLSVH